EHVPGDFLLLAVRRVPGPAHERALPQQGQPPASVRAYPQRLRRRRRPRADRGDGDLPALGWRDRGARCAAAVYGRDRRDQITDDRCQRTDQGDERGQTTILSSDI